MYSRGSQSRYVFDHLILFTELPYLKLEKNTKLLRQASKMVKK